MRGILIRLGKIVAASVIIFLTIFSFAQIALASPITSPNIIELTNKIRIKNGLSSLSSSDKLTTAAQNKAQDMVNRNYWSHETPEGEPFWVIVDKNNYDWLYLGENLAADFRTTEGIFNAWYNSQLHRSNILNKNYQDIGVGISENIVVVLYGRENPSQAFIPVKIISDFFLNFYFLVLNF